LKRLWKLVYQHVESGLPVKPLEKANLTKEQSDMRRQLHQTIQKVSDDFGRRFTFNTAIAANMELVNSLYKFNDESSNARALRHEALEAIVLMLSPIVPHVSHQLWRDLGRTDPIISAAWPSVEQSALAQETLDVVVQINGKLRGKISAPAAATNKDVEALAVGDEHIARLLEGLTVKRIIVVPKKLVNIVI
jgi:leucyl-tRNA synthetase